MSRSGCASRPHSADPRQPVSTPDSTANLCNPFLKSVEIGLQEFLCRFVELPGVIEKPGRIADIALGLLQRRHVEEHQRLPQVMVRAETRDGADGDAKHARRLARKSALT